MVRIHPACCRALIANHRITNQAILHLPTLPVPPPCPPAATGIVRPYVMGKEARKGDGEPQGLTDMLPDWVGFGTLYGISGIPVLLVVGTVLILFYNSLK